MRVFILTSCVGTKKYSESDIKPILEKHGLSMPKHDLENEEKYKEALQDFILPASQMYQGSFRYVRDLVNKYRLKGDQVELRIISARYGLIGEETPIIPYECTFQGLGKNKIRERGEKLRVYQNLSEYLKNREFDQSLIILGTDYLLTVFDTDKGIDFFRILKTEELVVFASKKVASKISFKPEKLTFLPVAGIGDRNRQLKNFAERI